MSHTHMSYVTSGAVGSSELKGLSPLLMSRNLFMCVCVVCGGARGRMVVDGAWCCCSMCVHVRERGK